jgi:hypothetical protein
MWRRIPIVPMLFGAFAALALVSVLAVAQPALNDAHVFAASAAIGAAYVLILYAFSPLIRGEPRSTPRAVGRGCLYAAGGYFTLIPLGVLFAIITDTNFSIKGLAHVVASMVAFAGLGILGGLMFARFRRSETERRAAALETQAAAFAREQLELARDLQQRLLPAPVLETDRYRVTARNLPAAYVAGDFYDFVPLGADRLLLVIADVSGKGVSAGLIMATVKAIIPMLAAEQAHPAPLLGRLNERLTGQLPKREFVAIAVALYDGERGTVTIANAGLPDPLLVPSMKGIVATGPRYPIGIRTNLNYESITVTMAPGDRLILFTDGLPEATVNGEPLGYERLAAEIQKSKGDLDALFAALEKLGAAHDDDWTAVVLERR